MSTDDELMAEYPGALLICRVAISQVFPNCARYIAKYDKVENSRYIPDAEGNQPLATWKRIDGMQDVMSPADQQRTVEAGGVITEQQYGEALANGES